MHLEVPQAAASGLFGQQLTLHSPRNSTFYRIFLLLSCHPYVSIEPFPVAMSLLHNVHCRLCCTGKTARGRYIQRSQASSSSTVYTVSCQGTCHNKESPCITRTPGPVHGMVPLEIAAHDERPRQAAASLLRIRCLTGAALSGAPAVPPGARVALSGVQAGSGTSSCESDC